MPIGRVEYINRSYALSLIVKYHYSTVMPRLTKFYIGGFEGKKLVGVFTLGWGTRPHHTIAKLFPSLSTADYFEVGKLCVADEMPKNSESQFIAQVIALIKRDMPKIKILFSWADGIMGKPGYVYQASNFFYGGYIWTSAFLTHENIRVHVRSLQGITSTKENKYGDVSFANISRLGYRILFGKQFRYLFPTCNKREWKKLLRESDFKWQRGNYPKDKDIEFYIKDKDGKRKLDNIKMSKTKHRKQNPMLKNQLSLWK